eukprot:1141794-Rhodomonas_salina.2
MLLRESAKAPRSLPQSGSASIEECLPVSCGPDVVSGWIVGERWTDGQTDGWMNGWMDLMMHRWMDWWFDRSIDRSKDTCMHTYIHTYIDT